MTKIALVGNIASGKSTVELILRNKYNFPVLDTDMVCHNLLEKLPQIKEEFSQYDILNTEGNISREKLGQLVFNDQELKTKLENILYPHVRVEINRFFDKNNNGNAFVAIPLLFEAKMEDLFDKILFIYCDDEIRLERLIKRNNYTKDYAQKRLNSQMPQGLKIEKSDIIIYNNSDLKTLENELEQALQNL